MIDWDALVLAPCNAAFGEFVSYYPLSGASAQLTGIFSDRYLQTKLQDGVEIVDYTTVLSLRASLAQPQQGELFRCRGVLYVVTDVEPDGVGDIKISLRSANDQEAARTRLPAP